MKKGKALITGASSGIGREFSYILSNMGYELILVARRMDKLEETKNNCSTSCELIKADLSSEKEIYQLYESLKNEDIDILINNAGFGIFGEFTKTDLDKELNMLELNIKSVHILTKLFLNDFKRKNKGYILNVASSAAFLPGPLMSTYYATKAYVKNLTLAISEELKKDNSEVYIGALCPGPVETEFNDVAGVSFGVKSLKSDYVAKYAINKMFKKKILIVPGFIMKCGVFFQKLLPYKLLLKISYKIQNAKK